MGLLDNLRDLSARWADEQRAITPAQFAHGQDIDRYFETSSGVDVTLDKALSLPVFARCTNLYIDDIAPLPVDVFRKVGTTRVELPAPSWMAQPSMDPNYTWSDHVGDVVFSLVTDRNAFILCYPDRYAPDFFEVLDPQDIDVRTQGKSVVYVERSTRAEFTPARMVHIRAGKSPGATRAPSRVDQLRETIALGIAAEQYGGRFFRNGSTMSGVVEVPAGVQVDANKVKEAMERKHKGLEKSHALGVLTGGATFKSITVDAEKSQLLGLKEAVVEDVARSFGIPPYLVGSTSPGAVAYASTSNARIDYVVHGVVAIVSRLERAYSALIPGADTFVRFNLNALLRGDQAARFLAYNTGLQGKYITRQEVRDWEDLGPADQAPGVGTTDGGYMETPNNNAPAADPAPAQRTLTEDDEVRALTVNVNQPDVAEALREMREAAVEHRRLAAIAEERAERAEHRMALLAERELPTPVVTVEAPIVNVAAPSVEVNPLVRVDAPVINVPDTQNVRIVGLPPLDAKVQRDQQGRISGITE